MRKAGNNNGLILCLFINLLLSLKWSIPGIILLILHFVTDISIWWGIGALGLWIALTWLGTAFFSWLASKGNEPDPQLEDKNPYSQRNSRK